MEILIKDMELPDSCFLCRFCRRLEYGEYVGEDTAWECVASKKRITDGQDLIATFKHPDCPLVEAPDAQPDRNAQERYEDLCEYFKDCSDKGMGILGDRKEFKAWLERLHWHVVKCDELGRELEKLQSAQPDLGKYEYHYDHTDCIWYRPEARNRCPSTCAQYRDGWNDAMNYIFRDGKGYRPYRRDRRYEDGDSD